jgi:hypothetical protein
VLTAVRQLVESAAIRAASMLSWRVTSKRTKVRAPGEFTNEDVYALAPHFEKLHPGNRHIRYKIHRQLQVLRDLGLLLHIGKSEWRLP